MTKTVKVTRIKDGDTFVGKSGNREKVYRLAGVDTPEKGKYGSVKATTALKDMIGGKNVSVNQVAIGPYGRSIAKVKTSGGKSVNNAMKRYAKK